MAKAIWKTEAMEAAIEAMAEYGWDYMELCNGNTLYFVANSMPDYKNTFEWLEDELAIKKFSFEAVEFFDDPNEGSDLDRVLVVEFRKVELEEEKKGIDELPLKLTEVNGYLIEDIDFDAIIKEVK